MKQSRLFLIIILMLSVVLMAGCGQKKTETVEELHIGLMPDIGMLPLLVAQEEGFFTDENLQVELMVFKSAKDRDAALQGGQLDGSMSDLLAVYFLNSNKINVQATSITESRFLLLAAENTNIHQLSGLKNKQIGLSVNTVIEYVVDSILDQNNISAEMLSVPQIPVRMELLRNGQLRAASLPDPLATVLTKDGARILADSREMGIDPAVLLFTQDVIDHQEGALKNLYVAYNRAVDKINADAEKYRPLLLEKGQFPESVIEDIEIPIFRKAELPTTSEVKRILDWAEKKNVKKVDLGYSDLVHQGLF